MRASEPLQTAYSQKVLELKTKAKRLEELRGLYRKANNSINEKMLNVIPEETMVKRKRIAGVVLGIMAISSGILFRYVWKNFFYKYRYKEREKMEKNMVLAYLLLLPAISSILVFNYYPLLSGAIIFQDYNIMGNSSFVGLQNFAMVLFDATFWLSLLRTLEYVAWSLFFCFPISNYFSNYS